MNKYQIVWMEGYKPGRVGTIVRGQTLYATEVEALSQIEKYQQKFNNRYFVEKI